MKASAGSLVVARPRATRLRSRATDLCGSSVHFRYEPAARTSFTGASLDSIHEAVTTLEDMARTMRRVLGGAHPLSKFIQMSLQHARATLRAREETPSVGA